jgi:EAL domain-containing protein (putative c-di-GMP-specific phosphodiesterase class I)
MSFIRALKQLGCRFALDDFGSGMSSFTYLKTLPVDFLKIDGLFVRDISTDHSHRAIVEAIHRVGQTMGLKTIAEHVEDETTRAILQDIGVDYVQGYGVGRPVLVP